MDYNMDYNMDWSALPTKNSNLLAPPCYGGHHCHPPSTIVINITSQDAPTQPSLRKRASRLFRKSFGNLRAESDLPPSFDNGHPSSHVHGTSTVNEAVVLGDQLSLTLNSILTSIDDDRFYSHEADLSSFSPDRELCHDPAASAHALANAHKTHSHKKLTTGLLTWLGRYIAKADLYVNSRLPYDLPPMQLYLNSYRLLSLAAQYSERAYQPPQTYTEKHTLIDADWCAGTKAMVIKSVLLDDDNLIVFAIRGTARFLDWAVNLNGAPAEPAGFLDDRGNLCHKGFLSTARKMVQPVFERLRQLIDGDPRRASYSLLITGHSAGGAVASLLYAHMLATSKEAESELNTLASCFTRVHCITFGTPPVSLLPLRKPDGRRDLRENLFYTFVNEGDLVARADFAYFKDLIKLYLSPVPSGKTPVQRVSTSMSSAGQLVVLRSDRPRAKAAGVKTWEEQLQEGVIAQHTSDEQLRGVVWGDVVCHAMKLYAGRIDALAMAAMRAHS